MWNQSNQPGFVPIPDLPQQQQQPGQPYPTPYPAAPGYPQTANAPYPQQPQAEAFQPFQLNSSAYPPAYPPSASSSGYPASTSGGYPPSSPGYPSSNSSSSSYPPQPVGFQPGGSPYPPNQAPYQQQYPSLPQHPQQPYPGAPQQPYHQLPPLSNSPLTFVAGPGLPAPDPLYGSGVHHGPSQQYQPQAPTQFNPSSFVVNREPELDIPNNRFYSPIPSQGTSGYPPPVGPENSYSTHLNHPHQGTVHMASNMQPHEEVPTVRPSNADPLTDAQTLRKAMKGFGTDEAAIINVLTKRTNAERLNIERAYKQSFGKDLIKDLKSELGGRLELVVLALMTPRDQYIAQVLRKAMAGIGTKERILVDVLCSSTNHEIQAINAAYARLFNTSIERDLSGDTSGHFRRLLISMNTGGRSEGTAADSAMAAQDAQNLLQAGVKKWGTDESAFNAVLATRSWPQLRLTFHEYEKIAGHSLEKAIQGEFSGDIEKGMLAIVKCAKNRAQYFAERLHDSVAGLGTKDDDLIFIIVARSEVDLESIKQEYHRLYNKSLASDVSGDTSGDYKKILLALIG